jgi:hypothetical protein
MLGSVLRNGATSLKALVSNRAHGTGIHNVLKHRRPAATLGKQDRPAQQPSRAPSPRQPADSCTSGTKARAWRSSAADVRCARAEPAWPEPPL